MVWGAGRALPSVELRLGFRYNGPWLYAIISFGLARLFVRVVTLQAVVGRLVTGEQRRRCERARTKIARVSLTDVDGAMRCDDRR